MERRGLVWRQVRKHPRGLRRREQGVLRGPSQGLAEPTERRWKLSKDAQFHRLVTPLQGPVVFLLPGASQQY